MMFVVMMMVSPTLAVENIGQIKEDLLSPDPEVRSDRCLSLISEGKPAVGLLAPRLRDRAMLVRHCAAYALSRIGGAKVEKIFQDGLTAPEDDVRRISAVGLGVLGKADLNGLLPLLTDKNWEVRWSGAFALGRSGDRRALPPLGKIARSDPYYDSESESYPVREPAEKAIDRLNATIGWQRDLKGALALSRVIEKPLLLYFRRSGSDLCNRFERAVFTEEKIIDVAQRFIPVWLDYLTTPDLFEGYGVEQVPAIIFFSPDETRLGRVDRTIGAPALLKKMLAVLEREKSASRLRSRLKISPRNLETAWQLAECYLDEGRWDDARKMLESIIKSDPDNKSSLVDNALFARAYIDGKRGNYALAGREFSELFQKFPAFGDRTEAFYCWGLSALKAGKTAEAEEVFRRLLSEYPESNFAHIAQDILDRLPSRQE